MALTSGKSQNHWKLEEEGRCVKKLLVMVLPTFYCFLPRVLEWLSWAFFELVKLINLSKRKAINWPVFVVTDPVISLHFIVVLSSFLTLVCALSLFRWSLANYNEKTKSRTCSCWKWTCYFVFYSLEQKTSVYNQP